MVLGYQSSGIVVEVGNKVKVFKAGAWCGPYAHAKKVATILKEK